MGARVGLDVCGKFRSYRDFCSYLVLHLSLKIVFISEACFNTSQRDNLCMVVENFPGPITE